jgi:hypothetical protein
VVPLHQSSSSRTIAVTLNYWVSNYFNSIFDNIMEGSKTNFLLDECLASIHFWHQKKQQLWHHNVIKDRIKIVWNPIVQCYSYCSGSKKIHLLPKYFSKVESSWFWHFMSWSIYPHIKWLVWFYGVTFLAPEETTAVTWNS